MMALYKVKYSVMSIWVVFLTIYLVCCIPAVTPQLQPVFSVSLTVGGDQVNYNFNDLMFNRFYHCLRNEVYVTCDATRDNNGNVLYIRVCEQKENFKSSEGFTCTYTSSGFSCKRGYSAPDTQDFGCLLIINNIAPGVSLSQKVQMTWVNVENVDMSCNRPNIMISNLQNNIFVIEGTTGTPLPAVMTTRTRATTQAGGGTPDSTTISTGMQKSDDGDDSNNLAIIIGATAGGVVVLVIIVIIFWRCKKRTSTSSATSNKEYKDTDIYPYGDSALSNIELNLNSNSLNTNPNHKEPTPDMYAAVDPPKKPKKTKTSSDTINADKNNENKSQQKKPRFNQSLDYTEVDIDNDAGHYQSSAGVHNDQGVASRVTISPSAPPHPSAKPSYYNISSEAGKDPSATYSQVIKTSKTKDASTINENGKGLNPARDPSEYEEAVPRTDTQYTTVDPSENNTTIPVPDGVYAKLHDPLRNITDVYNEWPATDNAGK